MISEPIKKAQRWISESEPELGLGTVIDVTETRVQILFPASGEMRQYARDNAPLKRVRFRVGDAIQSHDDRTLVVREVMEKNGLIVYAGEDGEIPEAQLSDRISFHRPEDRLVGGGIDDAGDFVLRRRALECLHHMRQSPVRGFVGGRIELIPHQLYIADEVSSRQAPRVLLSDEVGLGKTIEACLILHRLLVSGRSARVLILVPDSLVHQWFVEMLRKFNIRLNIFDEERCASIETSGSNPFLDDQLVLCPLSLLTQSSTRAEQARQAGWDVLVVDEAHHLEWSTSGASREYEVVEALSQGAEGLLLLTATPEQLGPESHFARLRLLDPERYSDFAAFTEESTDYQPIAEVVDKLRSHRKLTKKEIAYLDRRFPEEKNRLRESMAAIDRGDESARQILVDDLLDMHGPGRVVFRNTRAAMSGFPRRRLHGAPLAAATGHDDWVDRVSTEFAVDAGDNQLQADMELTDDPRVDWLAGLLQELAPRKILLICRSQEKVLALDEALRRKVNVKAGVFHEGLTLVQRDRNAAWFAGEEDVRLLICSEIGSEGRNFQFAHHLVLFDLPLNPELLEQRIGRLDRIGQTEDIHLHVPYLRGSPQEVLSRWYHEGLNAFESSLEGGHELLQRFGRQVHDVALEYPAASPPDAERELKELVRETAQARLDLARRLEQGRDRLLEWNSFRPDIAGRLVDAIGREDNDDNLEEFMLDVFEHFGVHAEELGPGTYHLNAQGVTTDAFPSIPEDGMIATFHRRQALAREEIGFLSWDHPMVSGAIELLLGSEKGNSSFAVWPCAQERTILLETIFVLETVAEARWHADRFLPATPLRVVVDRQGRDVTEEMNLTSVEPTLRKGNPYPLIDNPEISQKLLPGLVQAAQAFAEKQARNLVEETKGTMNRLLRHEIERLKILQKINNHVRPREIELAHAQEKSLMKAVGQARLRLDAVRLIWKGPPEALV